LDCKKKKGTITFDPKKRLSQKDIYQSVQRKRKSNGNEELFDRSGKSISRGRLSSSPDHNDNQEMRGNMVPLLESNKKSDDNQQLSGGESEEEVKRDFPRSISLSEREVRSSDQLDQHLGPSEAGQLKISRSSHGVVKISEHEEEVKKPNQLKVPDALSFSNLSDKVSFGCESSQS